MAGYNEDLERDGFVIIKSLFRGEQLEALRAAASRAEDVARRGQWPYVRTVGKQFPPWPTSSPQGIWGVQHLLHPSQAGHDEFARAYFSDELLGAAKQLLGCGDDELVMELLNMLVRPDGGPWELRWHRDDIGPNASAEEEMRRLGRPAFHAQFNVALWEDASLVVVPGSHRRARTEAERGAGPHDRLEGETRVRLGPGDAAFYNHNILHRGVYDGEGERLTVHGSVGHVDGGEERARVVLQHGVREWVGEMDLAAMDWGSGEGGARLRARAEAMKARLLKLGEESGDVGYSLEG
ncbi:hypothetical protein ESCO_005659 [Escovopsis weberi]|uniref:Nicotinamide N-methyltransferase n=1 Tax=Escovopsis weberi TaxID=150374 RepID=A0A0M8MZ69_ESCWE|nr:hypothetical protein ESCO_005659 [Escovopsis weberi]